MKRFFTGKNNQSLIGRAAILLIMSLIAACSLLLTVPLFAQSSNGRTLPLTLTASDLDQYCSDQEESDFSSQTIDPNNAQCDDTTPITNDENDSDLTFTGACQDMLQDWLPDTSKIKARMNTKNNSVECYDNGSGKLGNGDMVYMKARAFSLL
jgi:hypothetical protein